MLKLFTHPDWGYVIYEDANGKQLPYPKDSNYFQEGNIFTLKEEGGRGGLLIIQDSTQVFNEAGDTAFTNETMLEFFRVNTGKSNGGSTPVTTQDDEWGRYALNTKYSITTNVSDGIVIQGVIQGDTCYRYITNSLDANGYPNEDSFYSDFDGTNLTNLITTRG